MITLKQFLVGVAIYLIISYIILFTVPRGDNTNAFQKILRALAMPAIYPVRIMLGYYEIQKGVDK